MSENKAIKFFKEINTVDDPISPNSFYAIRTKEGFDLKLSDSTGKVLHNLNTPSFEELREKPSTLEELGLQDEIVLESRIGKPLGIVPLDEDGKVAARYLPSDVDDVREFENFSSFPPQGEGGVLFLDKEENTIYRWSETQYVKISDSAVLSVNGREGHVILEKSDITGLENVENTKDYFKKVHTARELATPRSISIGGGAEAYPTEFNGSSDITLNVQYLNPDYLNAPVPVSKGGTGGTDERSARTSLGIEYVGGVNLLDSSAHLSWEGVTGCTVVNGEVTSHSGGGFEFRSSPQAGLNFKEGDKVTVSFDCISNSLRYLNIRLEASDGINSATLTPVINSTTLDPNKTVRLIYTTTMENSIKDVGINVSGSFPSPDAVFSIKNIKVERGSVATGWCLSEKDEAQGGRNLFKDPEEMVNLRGSTARSVLKTSIESLETYSVFSCSVLIKFNNPDEKVTIGLCNAEGDFNTVEFLHDVPIIDNKIVAYFPKPKNPLNCCVMIYPGVRGKIASNTSLTASGFKLDYGHKLSAYSLDVNQITSNLTERFDTLKVGGVNLIVHSKKFAPEFPPSMKNYYPSVRGLIVEPEGVMKLTTPRGGLSYQLYYGGLQEAGLVLGKEYTLSGWVRSSREIDLTSSVNLKLVGWQKQELRFKANLEWSFFKFTFKAGEEGNSYSECYINLFQTNVQGIDLYFKELQLEEGNVATSYKPAPEDAHTVLSNTLDVNKLKDEGIYSPSSLTNGPGERAPFLVEVFKRSEDTILQRATSYSTSNTYQRVSLYGGSWTDWLPLASFDADAMTKLHNLVSDTGWIRITDQCTIPETDPKGVAVTMTGDIYIRRQGNTCYLRFYNFSTSSIISINPFLRLPIGFRHNDGSTPGYPLHRGGYPIVADHRGVLVASVDFLSGLLVRYNTWLASARHFGTISWLTDDPFPAKDFVFKAV